MAAKSRVAARTVRTKASAPTYSIAMMPPVSTGLAPPELACPSRSRCRSRCAAGSPCSAAPSRAPPATGPAHRSAPSAPTRDGAAVLVELEPGGGLEERTRVPVASARSVNECRCRAAHAPTGGHDSLHARGVRRRHDVRARKRYEPAQFARSSLMPRPPRSDRAVDRRGILVPEPDAARVGEGYPRGLRAP